MTTTTAEQTSTAVEQWARVRAALPVPVLLVPNLAGAPYKTRSAVHVLALHDVVRCRRVIVGLDVPPHIIAAESCFCASDQVLDSLQFAIARARNEQHLYPTPTCLRCIRFCESMTHLPVDQITARRDSS